MANYIAKIDENNVVTQVITANPKKIADITGVVSQAKAQAFAEAVNGAGTYILYTDDMAGTYPSVDDVWHAEDRHFHGPRPVDRNGNPCNSWTLNENCFWVGPFKDETNRAKFDWDEAEQKWYSYPSQMVETSKQSYWDTATQTWIEVTE